MYFLNYVFLFILSLGFLQKESFTCKANTLKGEPFVYSNPKLKHDRRGLSLRSQAQFPTKKFLAVTTAIAVGACIYYLLNDSHHDESEHDRDQEFHDDFDQEFDIDYGELDSKGEVIVRKHFDFKYDHSPRRFMDHPKPHQSTPETHPSPLFKEPVVNDKDYLGDFSQNDSYKKNL